MALDGLIWSPARNGKTIAVWLGGLTSRFTASQRRLAALARILNRKHIAFGAFDTRGHGVATFFKAGRGTRKRYLLAGTAFERFEDCVLDIGAIFLFLKRGGYKKIFFLGHSTGANKLAYYIKKTGGRGAAGFSLIGALSDVPGFKKKLGKEYGAALKLAAAMARAGRGEALMPLSATRGELWSARRFLSVAREGSNEDAFQYYHPGKKFSWAKRARVPILVLFGSDDEHADMPVMEILAAFRREIPAKYFSGAIIRGADHGFAGKERSLAARIAAWIKSAL